MIVIALVTAASRLGDLAASSWRNRLATVPELLPKTTLVLVDVPIFTRTREHWHESDLYQIWHEPAVQEWLQKPLAQLPQKCGGRKTLEEFLAARTDHGFVALTVARE